MPAPGYWPPPIGGVATTLAEALSAACGHSRPAFTLVAPAAIVVATLMAVLPAPPAASVRSAQILRAE